MVPMAVTGDDGAMVGTVIPPPLPSPVVANAGAGAQQVPQRPYNPYEPQPASYLQPPPVCGQFYMPPSHFLQPVAMNPQQIETWMNQRKYTQ